MIARLRERERATERWRLAGWPGGVSPPTRQDAKLSPVTAAARRQRFARKVGQISVVIYRYQS